MERNFTEQELVRREKLEKLRSLGLDPFGDRFDRDSLANDIKEKYKDITHEELDSMDEHAKVAGRIMFIRKMGKASFFSIQDKSGKIQIYISINDIGEEDYTLFKTADIGDIVGVEGKIMKTMTGEVTIKCLKYTHLVKALKPLPEKFHGLQDKEERYRRRYVDLIMNEESKRVAFLRPRIISIISRSRTRIFSACRKPRCSPVRRRFPRRITWSSSIPPRKRAIPARRSSPSGSRFRSSWAWTASCMTTRGG